MANIIDSLRQYLRGGDVPVNQAGDGYVAQQVDPRFEPRANASDMVPDRRGLGGLMDNVRGLFDSTVTYEAPPEKLEADKREFERLVAEREAQLAGQQPAQVAGVQAPTPVDEYMGQGAAQLNPDTLYFLENTLFPLTRQYGIPDELAAAQWALEGDRGRSQAATQGNNPFGLLWGGTPHNYQSLDNAVADYDRTLRSILGYNKGLVDSKGAMPEFDYSQYTPEDLAWTLMFTDLAERRALEGDPLYGDPSASQYRYEAHSDIPDYTSLLMNTPEWQYFSQY